MPDLRDPEPAGERQPPDAGHELRVRLSPDVAGLASGKSALRAFLAAAGASDRAAYYTELAFEELLTNLIRHGRAAPDSAVDVAIRVGEARVVLDLDFWLAMPRKLASDE